MTSPLYVGKSMAMIICGSDNAKSMYVETKEKEINALLSKGYEIWKTCPYGDFLLLLFRQQSTPEPSSLD
jgi:5,10-methylene-tetrahydrofolate dehydrogenase/methenyl tetrahydrofolate cyclohydrolase